MTLDDHANPRNETVRAEAFQWLTQHVHGPLQRSEASVEGPAPTASYGNVTGYFLAGSEFGHVQPKVRTDAPARVRHLTELLAAGPRPVKRDDGTTVYVWEITRIFGPGIVTKDQLEAHLFARNEGLPFEDVADTVQRRSHWATRFVYGAGAVGLLALGVGSLGESFPAWTALTAGVAKGLGLAAAGSAGLAWAANSRAEAARKSRGQAWPAGSIGRFFESGWGLVGLGDANIAQLDRFRARVLEAVEQGETGPDAFFTVAVDPWHTDNGGALEPINGRMLYDEAVDLFVRPVPGEPGKAEVLVIQRRRAQPLRMF